MEVLRNEHMKICLKWEEFASLLDGKNIILSPFCGGIKCEERIKEQSTRDDISGTDLENQGVSQMGAKTLCA